MRVRAQEVAPRLNVEFQPKQQEVYEALSDPLGPTRLGAGGSRGGGKSKLRDMILIRRFQYPGSIGWIIRRTVKDVMENHADPMIAENPFLRGWFNKEDRVFSFPNGSKIFLHVSENDKDIYGFRGKAAQDILLDESNFWRDAELTELYQCNRAKGVPDGQCKFLETFNPGGVGNNRIRRVFVDRNFKDNEKPEKYRFYPFFAWDNVTWSEERLRSEGLDPADYYAWTDTERFSYFLKTPYGETLDQLPEPDRSMQLEGKFDRFEGQVFPHLSVKLHDLDQWVAPREWGRFVSQLRTIGCLDHGTTGTVAYLMQGTDVWGNGFALEEHCQRNRLIREHVEMILEMKRRYPEPDYELIDPSTDADTQQNAQEMFSVQKQYADFGLRTQLAARTLIGVGLGMMQDDLKVDAARKHPFTGIMGSPAFFTSRSRCPNLWEEMTNLEVLYKDGKTVYQGRDHVTDCRRYVRVTKPPAASRKIVEPEAVRLAAQMDRQFARKSAVWGSEWDKEVALSQGKQTTRW